MQPVQLSLLPDQVPAPPPDLLTQLPGPQVTAAITALAGLIAKAGPAGGGRAMSEWKVTASHRSRAAVILLGSAANVQVRMGVVCGRRR